MSQRGGCQCREGLKDGVGLYPGIIVDGSMMFRQLGHAGSVLMTLQSRTLVVWKHLSHVIGSSSGTTSV
jgi:hypothetical protein